MFDIILGSLFIYWALPKICNPAYYQPKWITAVMVIGVFAWSFVIVTQILAVLA